jgi:hypothetical protein
MTAKAEHPTLKAAIYFYIVLFLAIAFLFLIIIVFANEEWLGIIVEITWSGFRDQFPDEWQLCVWVVRFVLLIVCALARVRVRVCACACACAWS